MQGGWRGDIDGLRALAVIPVVLFHAGVPGVTGGFVGVDVFFVVSGFLITGIIARELAEGRFSLIRFYERRARRILPALTAVVAASLVLGWFAMLPEDYARLAKSAAATAVFLSNFWFWRDAYDYFSVAAELRPLLHAWSLAVEEQFYLLFPLLLMAAAGLGRRGLFWLIAAGAAASLGLAEWAARAHPPAAFYLAPARAWELGLGALMALGGAAWLARLPPTAREALAAAGLLAILAPAVLYGPSTTFPGLAALLPCLGAAALIGTGAAENGAGTAAARVLAWRPVAFFGLISYSLYLWHWPILVFLRLRTGELAPPPELVAAALLGSVALAWVSWRFIERPFRRPGLIPRRAVFAAAGAGAAALLAASAAVVALDGAPGRLPPAALIAAEADRDIDPRHHDCFGRMPAEGLCRLGAAGREDDGRAMPAGFLLWGDSHADALMPAADLAAHQAGRRGIVAAWGACPPLMGVDRLDQPPDQGCRAFNDAVMAMVRARDDLPLVILSARWPLVTNETRPAGDPGNVPVLADDAAFAAGTPPTPAGNPAVFARALTRTVAALRAAGREVAILGGVPEIGWDVPEAMLRQALWREPVPAPPDRAAVAAREARAAAVIARLAALPGVEAVEIADALCAPVCAVTLADGWPAYHDDDHLSARGAREMAAPILADLLRRAPRAAPRDPAPDARPPDPPERTARP